MHEFLLYYDLTTDDIFPKKPVQACLSHHSNKDHTITILNCYIRAAEFLCCDWLRFSVTLEVKYCVNNTADLIQENLSIINKLKGYDMNIVTHTQRLSAFDVLLHW